MSGIFPHSGQPFSPIRGDFVGPESFSRIRFAWCTSAVQIPGPPYQIEHDAGHDWEANPFLLEKLLALIAGKERNIP